MDAVHAQHMAAIRRGQLGKYLVLRDVYGDVFTYAGLGSIAHSYSSENSVSTPTKSPVVGAASTRAPIPTQPATAGTQPPLEETSAQSSLLASSLGQLSVSLTAEAQVFVGRSTARAAVARTASNAKQGTGENVALRRGSVVASGTVLGQVSIPSGDRDGHLRFAIQPAGDTSTIDPGPVLANWKQLQTALHTQAAKATNALLGATTSDLFLMSKDQLESTVLADPVITMTACDRREVAAGRVDKRVLAVLAFLSRSGLAPTVSSAALRTGSRHGIRCRLCATQRRRRGHRGDQRHCDCAPPRSRHNHRSDDPCAADAAERIRAPRNRQPDAVPRGEQHARRGVFREGDPSPVQPDHGVRRAPRARRAQRAGAA